MNRLVLALTEGCRRIETPTGPALEIASGAPLHLGELVDVVDEVVVGLVDRLLGPGAREEELAAWVIQRAGFEGLRGLYPLLFGLHARCLLGRRVGQHEDPLLSGVPINTRCPFSAPARDPEKCQVLSRFATIRRIGEHLSLESPLGLWRVTLHGGRAAVLLAQLTHPRTGRELARRTELDPQTAERALDLLHLAGLLSPADDSGQPLEDRDPALRGWQHHDLLFHGRSRWGSHAGGYGGTFPLRGQQEPLPALRPDHEGVVIELPRPDLDRVLDHDPPFTRVLEERRSRRRLGDPPLDLRQLGELLFRAARVVRRVEGGDYEVAWRPYPGGGGAYELEVYLLVDRCQGLEPGLYHYRPLAHQLVRVAERTAEAEQLLDDAARILRTPRPLQVLVQIAARFRRLSWKYESMAYATILKDVGVLLQTLYLVATAMDLAVCAVGGGNSQTFAHLAGTNPWDETTVGEMVVGSRSGEEAEPGIKS